MTLIGHAIMPRAEQRVREKDRLSEQISPWTAANRSANFGISRIPYLLLQRNA